MEHLRALVSPSISSNRWRYLSCKCGHWPIGVCKRMRCIKVGKNDDTHIGMPINASQVFHIPCILLLSCKVDVSLWYSLMEGKRGVHQLLMDLHLPFGDPDGKGGIFKGFCRTTFSVVQTSWLLCLVCVTTLTVFCKGMENSVFGAMNVWGGQLMVMGGHDLTA